MDGLATSAGATTPQQPIELAAVNGGGPINHVATPTSSGLMTPTHSVAMPTPLLQAVYDRTSQQPLYILQSPGPSGAAGGHTLIPVQGIQMAGSPQPSQRRGYVTSNGSAPMTLPTSTLTLPTSSIHMDQLTGKGCVASLQTPPPGTPKGFGGLGPQAFQLPLTGPQGIIAAGGQGLDGLLQPSHLLIPPNNGGTQLSEAGPIRTIVRQAAKERPSPVAMDGESRSHDLRHTCSYLVMPFTYELSPSNSRL